MKTTTGIGFVLALATAAAGCAGNAGDAASDGAKEDATGKATSAFTGRNDGAAGVRYPTSLPMGSDAGQACFLTGVAGSLESRWDSFGLLSEPMVQMRDVGSAWSLNVDPTPSFALLGSGSCVPKVARAHTSIVSWSSSTQHPGQAQILAPVTANRRCFLTMIGNNIIGNYNTFSKSTDNVQVFTSGASWYIGGTGDVYAQAACMDVSNYLGYVSNVSGGVADLGVDQPGKACFLTSVGGSFRHEDFSDGAVITLNPGTLHWEFNVSNGKSGVAECDI